MLTRFRAECTSLYSMSLAEAKRLQHAYVGVEHVALALLRDPVYPLTATLQQTGLDAATLMREFEKKWAQENPLRPRPMQHLDSPPSSRSAQWKAN